MSANALKRMLIFVPILFALACSTLTPKPAPSASEIEKEEEAIYAFFAGTSSAVILENTSAGIGNPTPQEMRRQLQDTFQNISGDTIESFVERNAEPGQLSAEMELGVDYVLLSEKELAEISSQPDWGETLAERYPGSYGYLIFSRVGFNRTLDQAVIYVGNVAGPLMGSGDIFLMEKVNGEWVIKEQFMIWIS